jgi:glycosyltransferase involved in cell wall biosynthesis
MLSPSDEALTAGQDRANAATRPLNVVYLVNFLAPDLVEICRQWGRLVGRLDVLVSVPMEGNRAWTPSHGDVNVTVQRTWTISRIDRHPSGYQDVNFVHIPLDTYRQLRRLKPAVIVSAEMGARSWMASIYRMVHRRVKHIVAVSTSEHIERSRDGRLRRLLRRWLLRRADAVTFHGDSCRQYLVGLGVPQEKLHPWNYAADPSKPYRGELAVQEASRQAISLLTVGQLIERKGLLVACEQLKEWATQNPDVAVHWTLVGDGPLKDELSRQPLPPNLRIHMSGNCGTEEIQAAYREHSVMLFPTLGDEWGLVVDEAMHSGLVVIGSQFAQSCCVLIQDGTNGFVYQPTESDSLGKKLNAWTMMSTEARMQMRVASRQSVVNRTPEASAKQIAMVIQRLI